MFEIQHYRTAQGVDLFDRCIEGLRDGKAVAKVLTRINRVSLGNFGDYRALDGGVSELRIDWGPGYRVYFARSVTACDAPSATCSLATDFLTLTLFANAVAGVPPEMLLSTKTQ